MYSKYLYVKLYKWYNSTKVLRESMLSYTSVYARKIIYFGYIYLMCFVQYLKLNVTTYSKNK